MNILITNDDGIRAHGIIELAKEISKIANVYVVAPESQRSATGHAITMHNPIMVNDEYIADGINAYSISGTPADCVKIGIEGILKDVHIDLVLSGINNGPNLGTDVVYSGTVSAAMEGFIQNKPSIAISYDSFNISKEVYREASKHIVKIIQDLGSDTDIFTNSILNINIPAQEVKGTKVTILGERRYENDVLERVTPRGIRYFWIGGTVKELEQHVDSDVLAVKDGYISITPLNIEMTNTNILKKLEDRFNTLK